jgi:hypothetical protein
MDFSQIVNFFKPSFGKNLIPGNSSITNVLPAEVISNLQVMATILKAAGIIFIIYIIFLIIKGIWNVRRGIKIGRIYRKVNELDRKVDILLAHERLRVKEKELLELKEEEEGFLKRLFKSKKKRLEKLKKEEERKAKKEEKEKKKKEKKARKEKKEAKK